jgi:hypothetical protein
MPLKRRGRESAHLHQHAALVEARHELGAEAQQPEHGEGRGEHASGDDGRRA